MRMKNTTSSAVRSCRHWLGLFAVLDVVMTYTILFVFPAYGVYGAELNGVARSVMEVAGFGGMVGLKAASVAPSMAVAGVVGKRGRMAFEVFRAAVVAVAAFPVVVAAAQVAMVAAGWRE